jgi:hypothetical protein
MIDQKQVRKINLNDFIQAHDRTEAVQFALSSLNPCNSARSAIEIAEKT